MAKFFNEESNEPVYPGNVEENRFFNNQFVEEEVEDDTPSFVSASDAAMMTQMGQQVPEEAEEVYSGETDSNEFSSGEESSFDENEPVFNNYQEEYIDSPEEEYEETQEQYVEQPSNGSEQFVSNYEVPLIEKVEEPVVHQEYSAVVPQQEVLDSQEEVNNVEQLTVEQPSQEIEQFEPEVTQIENDMIKEEVVAPTEEVTAPSEEVVDTVQEEVVEETNSDNSAEQLTNIEESNAFTNVETSFVVDNTYKGVDNTGKTGQDIKNPVYIDALERNDVQVSGNPLAVLLVLIEILLSPGKSVLRNTEKYVKGKKVFKVFLTVVIYEFLFSLAGHIIGGCFVNKMTYGDYRKVLDFSNIMHLDYLYIIISSLIVIFSLVLLVTIINYATSFFSNKGLSFGTYLLLSTLSFFPLVLAINTFVPMLNVMSIYLSIGLVIVAFLYSFLIYTNALWSIMEFKGDNAKVFYLLANFILVTVVIVIVILVFFEDYVNAIKVVFK